MRDFQSELSSRRAPLMDAALCEDVTAITIGKPSAWVPQSNLPGRSQDWSDTWGLGSHDEEAMEQLRIEASTEETLSLKGDCLLPWILLNVTPNLSWNRFNFYGGRFF